MRRRDFITSLGGAVVACSNAARAQQLAAPVVGYLSSISKDASAYRLEGFRQGLAEAGFIEDRNVVFEYRYADGRYDRLPALAADLVTRQVNVIVALPSSPAAL